MRIPSLVKISAILWVQTFAPIALAQPDASGPSPADVQTAREQFKEASALATQKQWAEALKKYEISMRLRPSNLTRYSMAVVQDQLGLLIEAGENLRQFIASEHDETTSGYLPAAKQLLASIDKRMARIKITLPPGSENASVLIDGEAIPAASVGIPRVINPGEHRVEVIFATGKPFSHTIIADEGGTTNVHADPNLPVRPPSRGPSSVPQPKADSTRVMVLEPSADDSSTLPIVLTAGGGGLLVLGLVVGGVAYSKADSAESGSNNEADQARKLALVSDVSMGVGALAAGIGIYGLLTQDSSPSAASVTVSPWANARGAGFGCLGRF